jgi:protein-S-isoprenylcysteine O-methyltransferase Ste14
MQMYNGLLAVIWLIFVVYWCISAAGSKKTITENSRWWSIRALVAAGVLWLFYSHRWHGVRGGGAAIPVPGAVRMLGVFLTAIGIVAAMWARIHLGRNWGMPMAVKEEPELVSSGPYAYVRHPIYSGLLLALLGSALAGGLAWLIIGVYCGVYFVYSATQEETLMLRQFPHQYPDYQRRTRMLVPFLF